MYANELMPECDLWVRPGKWSRWRFAGRYGGPLTALLNMPTGCARWLFTFTPPGERPRSS